MKCQKKQPNPGPQHRRHYVRKYGLRDVNNNNYKIGSINNNKNNCNKKRTTTTTTTATKATTTTVTKTTTTSTKTTRKQTKPNLPAILKSAGSEMTKANMSFLIPLAALTRRKILPMRKTRATRSRVGDTK